MPEPAAPHLREPSPGAASLQQQQQQQTPPPQQQQQTPQQQTPPSVLGGEGQAPQQQAPQQQQAPSTPPWGDNWRAAITNDTKVLQRLERYATPKDVVDAMVAAQNRIAAGEVYAPLDANATDEQKTAWRKANGVPEKVDDYFTNLPDGLVVGEDDKTILGSFATEMHGLNVNSKVMHKIIEWYNDFVDTKMGDQAQADLGHKQKTEDALRTEWGTDYRVNINLVNSLLGSAPQGVKDSFLSARGPDGVPLGSNPTVLRWLVSMSRELNPVATLVPNSTNPGMGIEDEIKSIEKKMGTPEYIKDEKMQARYRDLVDARERMKKAS